MGAGGGDRGEEEGTGAGNTGRVGEGGRGGEEMGMVASS